MALTLNKSLGRDKSGKIQYDRAGSATNPIKMNDGSFVVRSGSATTPVTSRQTEVTRTETIGNKQLQITVKPATVDALGNDAVDRLIEKNMSQQTSNTSPTTAILIAAAIAVILR